MTDHTTAPATAQDENRLIAERRKLAKLRETGVAYNDFVPDARAARCTTSTTARSRRPWPPTLSPSRWPDA